MQIPKPDKKPSLTFNMTPMIDVVFLLIIFFMVTSNIVQQEALIAVDLPTAKTSRMPDSSQSGTRKITINVTGEDHLFLGMTPIDREQLRQYLTAEQSRPGRPPEVRIRTDRRVPYRAIEPLLVICSQAGIDNVSFNTYIDGNK
jgi:biopolymer transport protein ExbD